jgi:hypothetical protein
MKPSNIIFRFHAFLRKLTLRRKRSTPLDFTYISEHMRYGTAHCNGDRAHRLRDQHYRHHNPFHRGP